MNIPPELGRWFLRRSGTCVELMALSTDADAGFPFLMQDDEGKLHTYDSLGRSPAPSDDIIKVLPPAKTEDVKVRNSKPGDLVLFRNHTIGIVEEQEGGAFGIKIRSSITGAVTSHSTHGWAWGGEAPDFDVIVCFESSSNATKERLHEANTGSLRAMINRLADVVKKQGAEERRVEFERTRAGVIHLLDKMESDLHEN